jgi:hypothetical protein
MAMAFQDRNNENRPTAKGREDMNVETTLRLNHKTLVSLGGGFE